MYIMETGCVDNLNSEIKNLRRNKKALISFFLMVALSLVKLKGITVRAQWFFVPCLVVVFNVYSSPFTNEHCICFHHKVCVT